jgi:hypothetical protein
MRPGRLGTSEIPSISRQITTARYLASEWSSDVEFGVARLHLKFTGICTSEVAGRQADEFKDVVSDSCPDIALLDRDR